MESFMADSTTISSNLRHLLTLHGELSLSELARQTQIPQPTLHHLLNGTTKKPRRGVLERLANFFSVSIPQLTGLLPLDQSIPDSIKKSLNIATIPVISWAMVCHWPHIERASTKQIILDKEAGEHSFALLMESNTMEPLFPENSILIFDPDKKPRDRDFVLIKKDNNLIFNRLFIEKSELYIKQDQADGNMKLIKIKEKIDKIIGTLIEVRLQFL